MVRNAQQGLERDVYTDFLPGFADGTGLKSFEIIELAADDAPASGLRRAHAQREQDAVRFVSNQHADADPGMAAARWLA